MRKITRDACNAFYNHRKFKRGNTEVDIHDDGKIVLCLHDDIIAKIVGNVLYVRHCGYMTKTTKERLNGLPNVYISQRNFTWYLNGAEMVDGWNEVTKL